MSYRFELDVVLRFYICAAMRRRSITITRSLADASAAKYRHARVHRARYYERRWSLRKNVTSRYDKSSTCHAQIQFYEARSRRMEVHRQRRGTPRNTPAWSQAWRRLNSTGSASFWRLSQATLAVLGWRKGGVCRRTREGGFGYPLENGERIEVAMGTKSGWIPCFDLPTTRAPRRARVL